MIVLCLCVIFFVCVILCTDCGFVGPSQFENETPFI